MIGGSTQLIFASVLLSATVVILWFNAPPVPALVGALAAGIIFYRRRS